MLIKRNNFIKRRLNEVNARYSLSKVFAAGDYHHHIGSNVWAGRNLELLQENETGLAWFTIITLIKMQ